MLKTHTQFGLLPTYLPYLLIPVIFVVVGWINPCNARNSQYVLDACRLLLMDGTRDPAMDAENILINNSSQRQTIKNLIARLPQTVSQIVAGGKRSKWGEGHKNKNTKKDKDEFTLMGRACALLVCFIPFFFFFLAHTQNENGIDKQSYVRDSVLPSH